MPRSGESSATLALPPAPARSVAAAGGRIERIFACTATGTEGGAAPASQLSPPMRISLPASAARGPTTTRRVPGSVRTT